MKKRKLLHLLLFAYLLLAVFFIACKKEEEVQPIVEQPMVLPQDCKLIEVSNALKQFYNYRNKKLVEMRRTPYYYQFAYNSQGKISESKIFLVKYEEEVSTMKPDTLAPLEKYFWEGDKLVKLQQIRPNGTVRTEFLNEYDNQARLVSVKNQSPNDSEIYMSTYEYDSNGRLSKRIDRLTGRRNSKDYTNEIVYIEQYEYTTQKHPESLLKNSDLPYDIFGNDPWREWTPSKIIRAQFDYQENKLKQLRDIRIIVNKATADNIATEIELNMPIVSNQMEETFQQRIEVYAINTLCK